MARTKNALGIVDRLTGDDEELRAMIDEETVNAQVAQMIYAARTQAGLTQKELAERIGTRQPVIARLEDADYAGHSLNMLQRVAATLGKRLEVRLLTSKRKRKTA
jgi:ribosome-binding protein aMBF1 (putative translation factor)